MRTDENSDYTKLNQTIVTGTSFTDTCLVTPGVYTYMVRALNLQQSPSGTYYNLSEGISDTVLNDRDLEVHADGNYIYNGSGIVSFTNTSVNATNYLWLFDDGESSTLENPVHVYTDGNYIVTLIAGNDCDADTSFLTISILTDTKEIIEEPSVFVYPNPSSGKFRIVANEGSAAPVKIEIYSIEGKIIFENNKYIFGDEIDLSHQLTGLYVLHISTGNRRGVQKIILQK
jgi:PKD repeat protein